MKILTLIAIGAALFSTSACERITEESIETNATARPCLSNTAAL
ncbi:MAG: hypothetical protein AAED33_00460 [Paracoccaceae bacterium]|jgi:hypothetical protein